MNGTINIFTMFQFFEIKSRLSTVEFEDFQHKFTKHLENNEPQLAQNLIDITMDSIGLNNY